MADRISQYPMLPNFTPNNSMLPQQQQQQQQQDGHQPIQGFSDPNRMWQHMQQMQQFRPRSGADMNPQQQAATNAQMADLIRSQNIARAQSQQQQMGQPQQQQQQQQQQQHQFGLGTGVPQLGNGTNGLGGANQQQPFHDPSSQSSHMSQSGFPNIGGMSNANMNHTAAMQQRNGNNFLQGLQQNQGINRQLDLLALAQNQQSQNGPINFAKFTQHQQQQREQIQQREREQQQQQQQQIQQGMNQSTPRDIFSPGMSNEAIRRPSPSHPPTHNPAIQPSGAPGNPSMVGGMPGANPNIAARRAAVSEIESRLVGTMRAIAQGETQLVEFSTQFSARQQQGQTPDAEHLQRARALTVEVKRLKEMAQGLKVMRMNAIGALSGVQGVSGGVGQPGWMSQAGPSQPFDNSSQGSRGGMTPHLQNQQPQRPPTAAQSSPSLMPPQVQQGNHLTGQGVPIRSGPTPLQQGQSGGQPHSLPSGAPFPSQMQVPHPGAPTAGGGVPQQQRPRPPMPGVNFGAIDQLPPALDKGRFEATYSNFCGNKNIKLDPLTLNMDGHPIDLFDLHLNVMNEGGEEKVTQKDLWSVIGGRMGFVQFPGTDKELPKSGPGAAQRLAHVYKEYLSTFDHLYIDSVRQSRIKMQADQANHSTSNQAGPGTGAGGAGQGQPGQVQPGQIPPGQGQPGQGPSGLHPLQQLGLNAQTAQAVLMYSNMPVQELQRRSVPEKLISFVETNRAYLQRTYMDQRKFQGDMRNNFTQGAGPSNQGLPENGAPAPGNATGLAQGRQFSNNQQQAALLHAMRQQQLLHQQNAGNNYLDRLPQSQQPQQPHPPNGPFMRGPFPSSEQMNQALMFIQKVKQECTSITIPQMRAVDIPIEQRVEYNSLIEQVYRQTSDMDQKFPMYFAILRQPEVVKKLISITVSVAHQRNMLSSGNPRYIIPLETLRMMSNDVTRASDSFMTLYNQARLQAAQAQQGQGAHQQQQHPANNMQATPSHGHPLPEIPQARPPVPQQLPPQITPQQPQQQQQQQQQHQQQQQQQQMAVAASMRPPSALQPPPKRKNAPSGQPSTSAAVSTPSPAAVASASTPVASAATPTAAAASPQAPRSPKSKPPPKPKQGPNGAKRKPSKAVPPPAVPPPAPPEQAPTPSSSNVNKRPREEESPGNLFGGSPITVPASEPSPPKRVKTEWEGPPDDNLKKKAEAVENIKTEEDATVFLEQMTELIKRAAGSEGQEFTSDITETLDMILKGYGSVPEGVDASSTLSLGDNGMGRESSPPSALPPVDAFDEFFDFSFGTLDDDDNGSKAPTPDLVPSSTNPSPESGSETDPPHHAPPPGSYIDPKIEDSSDPLRLGTWKEIDGGESAYYQPNEWKWDSPMPALDSAWAIFPS